MLPHKNHSHLHSHPLPSSSPSLNPYHKKKPNLKPPNARDPLSHRPTNKNPLRNLLLAHHPAPPDTLLTSNNNNLDRFLGNLKTENLRTERYGSPKYEKKERKGGESSKSKRVMRSFESQRSERDKSYRVGGRGVGSTRREKKGGKEGKVKSQKLVLSGLLKIHKNKGFS